MQLLKKTKKMIVIYLSLMCLQANTSTLINASENGSEVDVSDVIQMNTSDTKTQEEALNGYDGEDVISLTSANHEKTVLSERSSDLIQIKSESLDERVVYILGSYVILGFISLGVALMLIFVFNNTRRKAILRSLLLFLLLCISTTFIMYSRFPVENDQTTLTETETEQGSLQEDDLGEEMGDEVDDEKESVEDNQQQDETDEKADEESHQQTDNNQQHNDDNSTSNGPTNGSDEGSADQLPESDDLEGELTIHLTQSFFEKDDVIKVAFTFEPSQGEEIEFIHIDGVKKEVTYDETTNYYTVQLVNEKKSGVYEYEITSVTMKSGKSREVSAIIRFEILKDTPTVYALRVEELEDNEVIVSFEFIDPDQAMINSPQIKIMTPQTTLLLENVNVGYNEFKVNLDKDVVYDLLISGMYDLDTNEVNSTDNVKTLTYEQEIEIKDHDIYQLNFKGIQMLNDSLKPITVVSKNEPFYIQLDVTVETSDIASIMMNDKAYEVHKAKDGKYYIKHVVTDIGNITFEISAVTLESGKTIEVNENNVKTIDVIKSEPKIEHLVLSESDNELEITYELIDTDLALTSVYGILTDHTQRVLYEGEITNGLKINVSDEFVQSYQLSVYGDYELSDEIHINEKLMNEMTLQAMPKYKLTNSYSLVDVVDKFEVLELYYEFKHNDVEEIKSMTISKEVLEAIKLSDTLYKVLYKNTEKAGASVATLERVTFADDTSFELSDVIDFEVKKSLPLILEETFTVKENVEENKLTFEFDFEDIDNSATNSKFILYDGLKEVAVEEIVIGRNSLTFDVTRNKPYTIKLVTDYKLTDSYEFSESDYVLKQLDVSLIGDYELTIDHFKAMQLDIESVYFNKLDRVDVYFESSNISGLLIEEVNVNGQFYAVEVVGDKYHFTYDLSDDAGVVDLVIEAVKFENLHIEPITKTLRIEVLKDAPTISNFKVEEIEGDDSVRVSFDLMDADDAMSEGNYFEIKHLADTIASEVVKSGYNELIVELKKDTTYVFDLYAYYDLDTNTLTDEDNVAALTFVRDIFIADDAQYDFEFFGLGFYDESLAEISMIEREGQLLLHLDLDVSLSDVVSIVLNGQTFDVFKRDDEYYVNVSEFNTIGIKTFELTSVTLASGKVFNEFENNQASIEVVKKTPEMTALTLTEDGNRLIVNFEIEDEDRALVTTSGVIKDATGHVLYEGELVNAFEIDVSNHLTTHFEVELYADYELSENFNYEAILLGSESVEARPRFILENAYMSATSLNKNEEVEVYVELLSNHVEDIEYFNISKLIVEAVKVEDNVYKAIVNFGEIPGAHVVTLESLLLTNDGQFAVAHDLTFEILKDAPYIDEESFVVSENVLLRQVTLDFEVVDKDNALINQSLQLFENDTLIETYPLTAGANSVTLDLKRYTEYDALISSDYRLDFINETVQTEQVLKEFTVMLVGDYELELNDLVVLNNGVATPYFTKGSHAEVHFTSSNEPDFEVIEMMINGVYYPVEKLETGYRVIYPVQVSAGEEMLTITEVKLENLHTETVSKSKRIEVLKDVPTANITGQTVLANGDIEISYELIDHDQALTNVVIEVFDKANNKISTQGEDTITFTPNNSDTYTLLIKASYDLDTDPTNGQNEVFDTVLLNETISHATELLELKGIEEVTLYVRDNGSYTEVEELIVEGFVAEEYIAKISSPLVSELYLNVTNLIIEDNNVYLMLDYDQSVTYVADTRVTGTKVKYGTLIDGSVTRLTFDKIVQMIDEDPSQDITLTNDLDFRDLSTVGTFIFDGTYTGTFDGNGYTISNLDRSLFEFIEGTVKNLVISQANLKTLNGILAFTTQGATIDNVHIVDSNISRLGRGLVGAFTPISRGKTTFINSSVTNTHIQGGNRVGGLVGGSYDGLTVQNSYFEGKVTSNSDRVGGILGQSYSGHTIIENSYVDFELVVGMNELNGGFIGYNTATAELSHNLSLANGVNGYRYYGLGTHTLTNNYEDRDSSLLSNNVSGVSEISQEELSEAFFYETLGWDSDIWMFTDDEVMPTINFEALSNSLNTNTDQPKTEGIYIPNYSHLSQLSIYDESREIAYHNAFELMPFYDSKFIINQVNELPNNHVLNEKVIKTIYPLDEFGSIVYGLNNTQADKIKTLLIEFEDKEEHVYTLTYEKTVEGVAIYQIDNLPIRYNFNKLVLDLEHSKFDEILALATKIDFVNHIEPITVEVDSRLMRDWYNEQFKPNLEQIVLGIIESTPKFITYEANDNHNNFIMSELSTDNYLEWVLYTANYFDRYYNVEMGMSKLSDMFVLGGQTYYDELMNLDYLVNRLQTTSYKDEREYVLFYNTNLAPLVGGYTLKQFLDDRILSLTEYENPDDWFTYEIGPRIGQFRELGMENFPEAEYRGWTMINRRDFLVLPIISATDEVLEDFHLLTFPSQIILGSLNRYQQHIDGDDTLVTTYDTLSQQMLQYLEIPANWMPDPVSLLNAKTSISYDTRAAFPNIGTQEPELTEDPVMKWLYDEWNTWGKSSGVNAYANGTDTVYVAQIVIGLGTQLGTYTHETAHNMDGHYFYQKYGRRVGTGPEEHADGTLAQKLGETYVFNLKQDFSPTTNLFPNFTLDRIDTAEKVQDFYHDAFDTLYFLDYLIGLAFLELEPNEQAAIATQAEEINNTVLYSLLETEDFEQMNLQTIDDLYDNKLTLLVPQHVGSNVGLTGMLVSHLNVYWYHPHVDEGRADGWMLRRNAYEFLGEAGYIDGFVTYISRKSANDLDAIRQMTNDETMTYEVYKKSRFSEVEAHIEAFRTNEMLNSYIDIDSLIDAFKEALKTSNVATVSNVKRMAYGVMKRLTDDFTTGTVFNHEDVEEIQIDSAQTFMVEMQKDPLGMNSYILTDDLDFSDIVTENSAYIMDNFVGYFDGNGYSITGVTKPLFNQMYYSYVKDLTFANIVYIDAPQPLIANTGFYSGIENVHGLQINTAAKFFNNFTTGIELGSNTVQTNTIEIHTVEDLLAINTPLQASMSYVLMSDLDLSGVTSHVPIINQTFSGSFEGNGHTLSNLSQPLFTKLTGTVQNLTLSDVVINATTDQFGAISKTSDGAKIYNIRGNNIQITGNHKLGSLIGEATRTSVDNIDLTDIYVRGTGVYVGGVFGRLYSSHISNLYAHGVVEFSKTANGGIVGALRDSSTMTNIFSNVQAKRISTTDSRVANGGLIGHFETANGLISNSISYADATNATETISGVYKVLWAEDTNNNTDRLQNVYEVEEATGLSSITETSGVSSTARANLTQDFFISTLQFSEDIWDFTNEIPRLKNVQ